VADISGHGGDEGAEQEEFLQWRKWHILADYPNGAPFLVNTILLGARLSS